MNKTEREIQALIRSKANEESAKGSDVKIRFQKMSINGAYGNGIKLKTLKSSQKTTTPRNSDNDAGKEKG